LWRWPSEEGGRARRCAPATAAEAVAGEMEAMRVFRDSGGERRLCEGCNGGGWSGGGWWRPSWMRGRVLFSNPHPKIILLFAI
jgi:hypothetical protein